MRKPFTLTALFLLVFAAQTAISAQDKTTVELPMKFRGLMPAVEVSVNGEGPFLFAIDTGAQGEARIDAALVKRLNLKTKGQVQAGDSSGRNMRMLDTVEVDSITVGTLKFDKITAITRDYNTSPNLPKIDGILGFELFKDYLFTLDYPAQKVRIESGALPAANGKNILNFDDSRGIPVVELLIGSQKVKAHIDSGNLVGGFILPNEVVEKSNLAGEPAVVGRARTVSNEIEIKQVRLKDMIKLGGYEFAEPTVNFPALSNANIGSRVLSEFAVTFDRKNDRLKLERVKPAEDVKTVMKLANPGDYAGKYGERTISEENGSLYIQRPGAPRFKLVPVSKDEFTLEGIPNARIKFARDKGGKVFEIQVLTPANVWEKAPKEKQ